MLCLQNESVLYLFRKGVLDNIMGLDKKHDVFILQIISIILLEADKILNGDGLH